MKNALLLHGTGDNSQSNWFPWLKKELEDKGWKVWVPNLPQPGKPSIKRANDFLLANKEWNFTDETIIIGHSAGAVETMGILQQLPENVVIKKAILVAGFINDLGWENLQELFSIPLNFEKIKKHAQEIILINSDNDPYIPMEQAKYLEEKLEADLIVQKNQKHFSIDTKEDYHQFPFLLTLID